MTNILLKNDDSVDYDFGQKTFQRLHYPVDIIALCVLWYLAYVLSLRNLEEIMAEGGIVVEHSTRHR